MKSTQTQTQTEDKPTIGGKPFTQSQVDMAKWAFTAYEAVIRILNHNLRHGARIVGSFQDFYLVKKTGETYKLNSQEDLVALLEYDTNHGYWSLLAAMERAAEFICREIAKPLPADFKYVSPVVKIVVKRADDIKSAKAQKKSK